MQHENKLNGIILFSTMLLMILLSSFVLVNLHAVYLFAKASKELAVSHDMFYELEAFVRAFDWQAVDYTQCELAEKNPNQALYQLRRKNACSQAFNNKTYQFNVTTPWVMPDIQLSKQGQLYNSIHRILTVTNGKQSIQLRVVFFGSAADEQPVHISRAGQQSWRFITED